MYDGRGSVSETIKDGTVFSSLRYDAYGNVTRGMTKQDTFFAYNGEQYTPQTGLQYLRARHYDPELGSFTSKDTYLGNPKELVSQNRYTYGNDNPIMYQNPSGHAGIFKKIVSSVSSAAKSVAKTVTSVAKSVAKTVTSTAQKVTTAVKSAVKSVTNTVSKTVQTVKKTVSNTVKQVTSTVSRAVSQVKQSVNRVAQQVSSTVNKAASYVASGVSTAVSYISDAYETYEENYSPAAVCRYVYSKVKYVVTNPKQAWEDTKDVLESGLETIILLEDAAGTLLQEAGQWWKESGVNTYITKKAEDISKAYHDSFIGKLQTAVSTKIDKAKEAIKSKWENSTIGQFCEKAVTSVKNFYEEHKTAINIIIGVAVIALCVAATIVTAGGAGCLLASIAYGAMIGSITEGLSGAAGGIYAGAKQYMRENGTLDGSFGAIAESASTGFAIGAVSGMISGGISGAVNPMKCFVGGTMIAVFLGTMAIEDITPGTCVYAMDTETNEIALKEVVRTYENETKDVIHVTIGEESYTVTYGHPFYVEEKGFVDSEDLKEGDKVVLLDRPENALKDAVNKESVPASLDADDEKDKSKDGQCENTAEVKEIRETSTDCDAISRNNSPDNQDTNTATVKSVEAVHLQEPVKVYNFEVADSHTYYVGEQGVLVHNVCGPDVGDGNGKYAQSGDNLAYDGGADASVHGNSKLSTKSQHGYEIYDNKSGDVVKTGISGQNVNINGTSPRANTQINRLNKAAGYSKYDAKIVETNMLNRNAALVWEKKNSLKLWNDGNSMSLHKRPTPWEY